MRKATQLTPEGLAQAEEKLKNLEERFKELLSKKTEVAETGGNLWHDNPAFEELLQQEMVLEHQIQELKQLIRTAEIVNTETTGDAVSIGSTVTVRINGEEKTFKIVDAIQANPSEDKISYASPLGSLLMGLHVGEKVTLTTKNTSKEIEVIHITT